MARHEPGCIVWLKCGALFWPGEVQSLDQLPPNLQEELSDNKPEYIIKFIDEDSYEFSWDGTSIFEYNCAKKEEYIKKGMAKYRAKKKEGSDSWFAKFPKDIIRCEEMTMGDPDILEKEPFAVVESIRPNYSQIFTPSPSKKKKAGKSAPTSSRKKDSSHLGKMEITQANVNQSGTGKLIKSKNHEVEMMCQDKDATEKSFPGGDDVIPKTNVSSDLPYKCKICGFSSSRLNVIILHNKQHSEKKPDNVTEKGSKTCKPKKTPSKTKTSGTKKSPSHQMKEEKPKGQSTKVKLSANTAVDVDFEKDNYETIKSEVIDTKFEIDDQVFDDSVAKGKVSSVTKKKPKKDAQKNTPKVSNMVCDTPACLKIVVANPNVSESVPRSAEKRKALLTDWCDEDGGDSSLCYNSKLKAVEKLDFDSPNSSQHVAEAGIDVVDQEKSDSVPLNAMPDDDFKKHIDQLLHDTESKLEHTSSFSSDAMMNRVPVESEVISETHKMLNPNSGITSFWGREKNFRSTRHRFLRYNTALKTAKHSELDDEIFNDQEITAPALRYKMNPNAKILPQRHFSDSPSVSKLEDSGKSGLKTILPEMTPSNLENGPSNTASPQLSLRNCSTNEEYSKGCGDVVEKIDTSGEQSTDILDEKMDVVDCSGGVEGSKNDTEKIAESDGPKSDLNPLSSRKLTSLRDDWDDDDEEEDTKIGSEEVVVKEEVSCCSKLSSELNNEDMKTEQPPSQHSSPHSKTNQLLSC